MISRFKLLVVGLAVLALAIGAAACGDDDDNGGSSQQLDQIQATLDELVASSQRSHVLATMTTVRVEGLHELDQEAQEASEIQAGWSGTLTRIGQAVGGTNWPEELSSDASEWHGLLVTAADTVDSGDLAASKTAIAEAHAAWHGIEHAAYQYIAGEEVTGDDGHEGENSEDH